MIRNLNYTLGPGSYDWKKDVKSGEELGQKLQYPSNNFISRVNRMAPVIPGSSVFK